MKRIRLIFISLFLIQILIPVSMIIQKEIILNKGEIVKFQVQPVDPYDAFRGKYLSLGIVENRLYSPERDFRAGQKVKVILNIDAEGFARPAGIDPLSPGDTVYLDCTIDYVTDEYITFKFPFDRYYINEDYSRRGEELYSRYSRGNKEDAYISVRVQKGKAVLENMFLAGIEINQFIKNEIESNP